LNNFSVAQAFTPGDERMLSFKSRINGALVSPLDSHQGVNARARENRLMELVITAERSVEQERLE
jgi:hypothetical protein